MNKIVNKLEVVNRLKEAVFVPLNVIGVLENKESASYVDLDTDSVWVENDYFNYICGDENVINAHLDSLKDGFYGFSGVENRLAESIYKKHLLHWIEPTERYCFDASKITEVPDPIDNPVVSIPIEEARGIDDRYEYKQEGSFERIETAILERPTSAVYIDNAIASYVLVHEDNSIGYMFTCEKYRHMGLGYWVTRDIVGKMLTRGTLPYVEINKRNLKSQGLAAKTGFVKDAYTPWFGVIKGCPEEFKTWDPLNGKSYIFTSMAQLRYINEMQSEIQSPILEGNEPKYKMLIDEKHKKAELRMEVDKNGEAYVISPEKVEGMTLLEIVEAVAVHFPDTNASLVFPYDAKVEKAIGCITIKYTENGELDET